MQTTFNLPDSLPDDLNRFKAETQRFNDGSISAAEFRAFRVPQGVYEQRESGRFMLRVRFPAGGVLPHQMKTLAAVARQFGDGVLHVTTRQDIQVHRVLVDDIHPALVGLFAAGLSTKGGGGNTVRNITGCPNAGVCPNEVFDITPHAVALTEFLLPDPLSYTLPRKYKLAFSGCGGDCIGVAVNDVGFVAQHRNGSPGFAVYVGGGMGAISRVGELFDEFLPAEDIHFVAEAVKRVFDKHGNRKNRHRARLRFLIDKIGLEAFRELYEGELAELRKNGLADLDFRTPPGGEPPVSESPISENTAAASGEFASWRKKNVTPQRQDGYYLVQIPLALGDISAEVMEKLADVAQRHGERMLRTTPQQDLVMRWVTENELPEVHARLNDLALATTDPPVLRDLVACTGAATCRLGICLSRGLAAAIRKALIDSHIDLDGLGNLKIHISGCPNSCGRHAVADIGFFGAARRVNGRLVPHYVLQLGGRTAEAQTRLAEGKQTIPARNVPALVADLVGSFTQSAQYPDFGNFLQAQGEPFDKELAAKHGDVPDFAKEKNHYFDWDAEELFSLAGRGAGECGAGVFDMIEVDLESARDAVKQNHPFDATVLAAHALLVTKGQEAREASEVLKLFTTHFIDEALVEDSFRALIQQTEQAATSSQPKDSFAAEPAEVARFVEAIATLYDNMDPSLRFKPVTQQPAPVSEPAAPIEPPAQAEASPQPDREVDFRGVVCPLNYVKTKMVLDQLGSGKVLSVLLDEAGSRNVPESVEKDGHDVLSVEQQQEHWQVVIRKA